ncbi:MAG TPA: hypothetical protein VIQ29_25020 [Ancylobacter sp.]
MTVVGGLPQASVPEFRFGIPCGKKAKKAYMRGAATGARFFFDVASISRSLSASLRTARLLILVKALTTLRFSAVSKSSATSFRIIIPEGRGTGFR